MAQVTLQYVNELCWVPSKEAYIHPPLAPKMTVIEPRMKIASLQQKVEYLEKTVTNLEHELTEKDECIKSIQAFQNDQLTLKLSCDESSRDEAMRKLTYDIIEFNSQLQQRDQFIAHQEETIGFLQNSIQAENSELQSMKSLKEKVDEENRLLQLKVSQLEAELNNTQEATQDMRNRLNDTCRTIFTELKERFEEYCEQTTSQIESAEVLKSNNIHLTELVEQEQEKCLVANNEAAECRKLLEKQEIDIKMLSSELTKVEEENLTLMTKIALQNSRIQDLMKEIEISRENFQEVNSDFDKREKGYLDKIEEISSNLKIADEDKTQLKLELDLSNNELNKEQKLNAMYCLRIEELKSIIRKKLDERKVHDEETQKMKRKIKDTEDEQKCLETELKKLKEEESLCFLRDSGCGENFDKHLNDVDKLTCILSGLKNDVNNSEKILENERIHNCETHKRLKSAYNLLGSIKYQLTEKEDVISNLQDCLTVANTKTNQQCQRIKELEACIDHCQEEITKLKTVLTRTLTEQAESEEESCRKTEEMKRLHLEMSCMKRDRENRTKEHLRIKNNLECELARVRCDLQNTIEEFKKLKQSSFQKIYSRSENKEEVCRLKHLIAERQFQLDQKEKELLAIRCYNKELHELVEDKNIQLSDLSKAVETLQQDLDKTSKLYASQSDRNGQLECYSQQQKQEVMRLQKMLCNSQLSNVSQEQQSSRNSLEIHRSLEAQRRMTYTLMKQLNAAQSKISSLTFDKCNLEKRIAEMKAISECLSGMKGVASNDCSVRKKYCGQPFENGTDSASKISGLSGTGSNRRFTKDVTVGRFGQTYDLEDRKKKISSDMKPCLHF